MAIYSKVVSRLSSRLQPSLTHKLTSSSPASGLKSSLHFPAAPAPVRRISRLPLELSSVVESMMPLHSAIASARLISSLPIESQSWGLVPQGRNLNAFMTALSLLRVSQRFRLAAAM